MVFILACAFHCVENIRMKAKSKSSVQHHLSYRAVRHGVEKVLKEGVLAYEVPREYGRVRPGLQDGIRNSVGGTYSDRGGVLQTETPGTTSCSGASNIFNLGFQRIQFVLAKLSA